jgi:hypothetical protein
MARIDRPTADSLWAMAFVERLRSLTRRHHHALSVRARSHGPRPKLAACCRTWEEKRRQRREMRPVDQLVASAQGGVKCQIRESSGKSQSAKARSVPCR